MINAIEWFTSHGFTFDDKITIKDVLDLQLDARKQGMTDAKEVASETQLNLWQINSKEADVTRWIEMAIEDRRDSLK